MKDILYKKGLKNSKSSGKMCRIYGEAYNNRTNSTRINLNNQKKIVRGLVSVIMPVYNTPEEYLMAAVKSVLCQTYRNLELLIVDDGSEENCVVACDNLREDVRVRILHIMNSGVSAARNKGIDEAQGEFITFIDSDDTLNGNAIQTMVDGIVGVDFVTIGCKHVHKTTFVEYISNEGSSNANQKECINYLCYMNPPYDDIETNAIWGKLYRKELIGHIRFDKDMVMAEDFKFNFEYIMKNGTGKYLDFSGYNYLEHGDSISRNYKPAMMRTIYSIERMIHENKDTSIYDALVSRCVNIAFTILMMVPKEMREERRRIEQFISLYRSRVIINPLTKRKVKVACITSYLGYWFTRKVFKLNRR